MYGQYIHCHINTHARTWVRAKSGKRNQLQNITRVLIFAYFAHCYRTIDAPNRKQFQAFVCSNNNSSAALLDTRKRDSFNANGEMAIKERESEIRIVASKGKHM